MVQPAKRLIMLGRRVFGSVRLHPLVSLYALWVFVRIFIQILFALLVLLRLTYTMAAFTKRYKRLAPQMDSARLDVTNSGIFLCVWRSKNESNKHSMNMFFFFYYRFPQRLVIISFSQHVCDKNKKGRDTPYLERTRSHIRRILSINLECAKSYQWYGSQQEERHFGGWIETQSFSRTDAANARAKRYVHTWQAQITLACANAGMIRVWTCVYGKVFFLCVSRILIGVPASWFVPSFFSLPKNESRLDWQKIEQIWMRWPCHHPPVYLYRMNLWSFMECSFWYHFVNPDLGGIDRTGWKKQVHEPSLLIL